ncbi:LipL41-expression chaperone Lep [Leptospira inadai]|nr:LipL41-expression chaperone Lep [Leptospira inadai]PNV75028.1 LipL41-expression chaperone Lep [Leptospira inadai serovar Lyme]
MIALTSNRISCFFGSEKSGRLTSAFLFCILALFAVSCRTKPNPEECMDAQVHIVKLIADDESMPKQVQALMLRSVLKPETNEAIVKTCVQNKTLKQVQCELSALKFRDLQSCKQHEKIENSDPKAKAGS